MLIRTIQNNKNWQPNQSALLDKLIPKENVQAGIIHEEFPVGIRRAYRFLQPNTKQGYSVSEVLKEKNYGFRDYGNDLEMLNNLENYQLCNKSISNAFGSLVSDNLQYIDAVFINEDEVWVIEIKSSKDSKEFRKGCQKALGQILFYADLFLEDYPIAKIKRMMIICGRRDPFELIDETYLKYGVEVISIQSRG